MALGALGAAQCVVVLTSFVTDAMREYANVILPMAAFTETGGSFVNGEGRWQSFDGALKPFGDARPGWKILRVLGNLLELPGFEHDDVAAVRAELLAAVEAANLAPAAIEPPTLTWPAVDDALVRVGDWPCYRSDALVRRAGALQQRPGAPTAAVYLNESECRRLGLAAGDRLRVAMAGGAVELPLAVDKRVADGTAFIPSGVAGTAGLGAAYGSLSLERV